MNYDSTMRMQRIERLLKELMYECERGFMEGEIDESISMEHIVPVSRQLPEGVVHCRFTTRPAHRFSVLGRSIDMEPRLKLVKK